MARVCGWIERHQLLPNSYVQGIVFASAGFQARAAFVAGRYGERGWCYFFPLAILLKTPVVTLLLVLAGCGFCAIHRRNFPRNELFILLPLGIYLAATMTARINIGLRHVPLLYPWAILASGKAAVAPLARRRGAWMLAGLVAVAGLEVAMVAPHYLAFFNQLAGGPAQGPAYLVDSNLDWARISGG